LFVCLFVGSWRAPLGEPHGCEGWPRGDTDIQLLRVRLVPVFEKHSLQIRAIGIDLGDALIQQVEAVVLVEEIGEFRVLAVARGSRILCVFLLGGASSISSGDGSCLGCGIVA
jgi:hypothetical protein